MALMSLGVAKQADLRAIARICTKYNRGREYDAFLRNCQHFAGDLLESVKVSFCPVLCAWKSDA